MIVFGMIYILATTLPLRGALRSDPAAGCVMNTSVFGCGELSAGAGRPGIIMS